MKKRIVSMLLALVMVLGMLPSAASAEDTIEVSSQAELAAMEASAGTYVLTADITMESWTPISPAAGVILDGNGHTITLTGSPLFSDLPGGSLLKNLILAGTVTETENRDTGAAARRCSGTIRNCSSSVNVTYSGRSTFVYIGGMAGKVSGTISNCLVTGTVDNQGNAECYGAVSNIALFESGVIKNCIAVGCDRIGTQEGWSSGSPISGTDCTLIAGTADFQPEAYSSVLNGHLEDGDLSWTVNEGILTLTAGSQSSDPEATEEDLSSLNAAIEAAENIDASKIYTTDSWSAFSSALTKARELLSAETKKQSKVMKAAEALTNAREALTERSLSAVDLSDKEVISITTVRELESMQAGKYYRLDADLTLSSWFGYFFDTMNSVLDGNGHTITLTGSPIWASIGPDAVIQNLGILGSAQNDTNPTGALAKDCQGLIVNCWSRASVTAAGYNGIAKDAGGFTATLTNGGAIINCYMAGDISSRGFSGAMAGTCEANTLIKNCFWLNTVSDKVSGAGNGSVSECVSKAREDFYGSALLSALNDGKGDFGKTWTVNDEGWPHLGAAGSFVPPEPISLCYTAYEGYGSGTTSFSAPEGLLLSLAEVLPDPDAEVNYYIGRFTIPGYTGEIEWQGQYISGGQGSHKVFVSSDGELEVIGAGSLDIVAYDKTSWEKLASFTVTVDEIEAEDLRLIATGEYVTQNADGSYTVAGSGTVTISTQVKTGGVWKNAPSSLFAYSDTGSLRRTGNTFFATEPGSITVTVSGLGKQASVSVVSTYVPVTSISPALGGTYEIHGRNANSDSLGDFLDLTLSHGAGTVIVLPENASYRDSWTLTSDDPETAQYIPAFLRAVLPYRAGTVTLTAASTDPLLTEPVTGTSVITLNYYNPLTSVKSEQAEITVKENETAALPLIFTGSEGKEDYHVSEPGILWTFSGDGEVEITRSSLGVIVGEEGSKEYCIANTEYQLTGLKPGTVTVTGTPVDQTAGAAPVSFTVTVNPGIPEVPADIDQLVTDATAGALAELLNSYAGRFFEYGDEWAVFTLTRAGKPLSDTQIRHYCDSVKNTYTNPKTSALKPTTLARVILSVSILGRDAADFNGINLINLLCSSRMISDGSNEAAWALIALDCLDYPVPDGSLWDREALIGEILKFQNPITGAFGLFDDQTASPDMTAMCIQALAPYYSSHAEVKNSVDAALSFLQSQMDRSCDLGSSETISQVLIGLTALGRDPLAAENGFVKSTSRNLITALYRYRTEDGGFRHLLEDTVSNGMAGLQALQALTAYTRYKNNQTSFFDLTESAPGNSESTADGENTGESGNTGESEQENPSDSGSNGSVSAPDTGDRTNLLLSLGSLTACLIVIAAAFLIIRKKANQI